MWNRKYDKAFGWQAQRERELGSKFRKNKALTCKDLASIVEWKFKEDPEKKQRSLELVARNDEANVGRLTGQALSVPGCEDSYRMNCLTLLEESAQVLASIILTFFDPQVYCILDNHTWKALLGNVPPNMQTTQNYLKLLAVIKKNCRQTKPRRTSNRQGTFQEGLDESI